MQIKNYQNENQRLPIYGIGPYLVLIIVALSVIAIMLSHNWLLSGNVYGVYKILFYLIGVIFIVIGFALWYFGAVKSDISECIMKNELKTTGVFSLTRNPIYSGWWIFVMGVMLLWHNFWLLFVIPIQWLILTAVLCNTEERWLHDIYGYKYEKYCKNVNRLIPMKKQIKKVRRRE